MGNPEGARINSQTIHFARNSLHSMNQDAGTAFATTARAPPPSHNDRMNPPAHMDRACKVVRGLKLPGGTLSGEELACAVWSQAVGPKIAAHTRATRMVRTRLIVEVEDATWQRQLNALSRQIVRTLAKSLGAGLVEDLEFRVMPRRREPQRAEQAAPTVFADESNAIADPVLRSIYRAARKKALA